MPKGPVILLIGGPGSGKDTQCERLVAKYQCAHLSAVDVMRQAVTSKTQRGEKISNMITSGQIVPAQDMLDLLKEEMQSRNGPYVVQGFPKNAENLLDLERQCGEYARGLPSNAPARPGLSIRSRRRGARAALASAAQPPHVLCARASSSAGAARRFCST